MISQLADYVLMMHSSDERFRVVEPLMTSDGYASGIRRPFSSVHCTHWLSCDGPAGFCRPFSGPHPLRIVATPSREMLRTSQMKCKDLIDIVYVASVRRNSTFVIGIDDTWSNPFLPYSSITLHIHDTPRYRRD